MARGVSEEVSNDQPAPGDWRESSRSREGSRWRESLLVRLALALPQGVVLAAFLLLLVVAPLPLGANRDWAWAPMAVAVGGISVGCVVGTIGSDGWRIAADERGPLVALIVCFALLVGVGLLLVLVGLQLLADVVRRGAPRLGALRRGPSAHPRQEEGADESGQGASQPQG